MRPSEIHVWGVDLYDSRWDRYAMRLLGGPDSVTTVPQSLGSRRARAALRHLLARYLQCTPESLALRTGPNGRPEIASTAISFNLSHSRGRALIAVSTDVVGIDLEYMERDRGSPEELLDAVLHPRELDSWHRESTDDAWGRFYCLWVRKEAYAKALGFGLSRSFASYRLEAYGNSAFHIVDEEHQVAGPMYVHDVAVSMGFAAAICTPLADPLISSRTVEPQESVQCS